MARFLQGGGFTGAAIRGVSGLLGGAADAAGDMGRALTFQEQREREEQTPEQQAISSDSIFNTGSSQFDKLPEAQRDAIIRGTRSLNAERALQIKMAQAAARQQPQTATVEQVMPVGDNIVEVIYSNGIRKRMTLQQARNNGIAL